jgi:hypothetical protein
LVYLVPQVNLSYDISRLAVLGGKTDGHNLVP